MTLASRFKTDASAAENGVWIDITEEPNADGSIPGFLVARMSEQNRKYIAAIQRASANYRTADGFPDAAKIREHNDQIELEAFLATIILDWRHFQPDEKTSMSFSKENAERIFTDRGWFDLYATIKDRASRIAEYRQKQLEIEVKN